MAIRKFELMHGAVIVKICRNDRPVALTLIESDGNRATYRVNDVFVYVNHSTSPQSCLRNGDTVWQFTFAPNHIADLARLMQNGGAYLALVCANEDLSGDMEAAFLYPENVTACLDLAQAKTQSLRVRVQPRRQLQVEGRGAALLVERSRLDKRDVPNR